jgi:hypothetical protein
MDNNIDEILKTLVEYIGRFKNGIIETAELFQRYEESKGTTQLVQIIDGMEWITEALVATKKLDEERRAVLNNNLNEIVNALENGDFILVGDLLQYELLPIIEEIEKDLV